MLANSGSITDTRTGDKLHFGRIAPGQSHMDNPKSQPFLLAIEWDRAGSGTRMPCREQILFVTQNEGAVAGSHQRLRIRWDAAGVPRTAALRVGAGGVARARILGQRAHRTRRDLRRVMGEDEVPRTGGLVTGGARIVFGRIRRLAVLVELRVSPASCRGVLL